MHGLVPFLQNLLGIEDGLSHHEPRDQPRPARLVTGADARAVVPVEVLVEEDQVSPVWIAAELRGPAVYWPAAPVVPEEDPAQPAADLVGHLPQSHLTSGTRRTFDLEIVTVIGIHLPERLHDQGIDGHPDGTAPVRIAAEQARGRLRRLVVDPEHVALHGEAVGMIL